MADGSKIEWTDATWNPITGCSVVSPGCTNCYAMRLAGTRMKHHPSREGLTEPSKAGPVWNGQVRLNEQWLDQPLRWSKPRMIFVVAHGDLFHENVPDEWVDRVFAVMALCPQHIFQVLTKRAARMREYMTSIDNNEGGRMDGLRDAMIEGNAQKIYADRTGEDPSMWLAVKLPLPNVWLGVSVEDQTRAEERIPDLLNTPAAVRWVSAEPLLGPIDLSRLTLAAPIPGSVRAGVNLDALRGRYPNSGVAYTGAWDINGDPPPETERRQLDWVVAGGESGPQARPMHPDWARSLRDQCAAAGVPFHFKQWGAWKNGSDFKPGAVVVMNDGRTCEFGEAALVDMDRQSPVPPANPTLMRRVGKKAAGRLLDGVEHNGFPEAA